VHKIFCAGAVVLAAVAAASAQAPLAQRGSMAPLSPDIVSDLAPTGRLRAAINLGNAVLAQKDAGGELRGVTVDLARELARRAGMPLDLVPFEAAGKVFEALKAGTWDVAFLAIEPVRAAEIDFTAPYVLIEGTYMVPADSPLKTIADVDRPGVRIAVGRGSAYDLYLTRTIKNATLVRAHTGGGRAMIDLFLTEKLEAAAGVKQPLVAYARTDPNVRVMDGISAATSADSSRPRLSRVSTSFFPRRDRARRGWPGQASQSLWRLLARA
jgi:polar amino acid transport system substrate-binding protein